MPKVTFDLQVVTPLFLAGANQREMDIPAYSQKQGEKTKAWEFVPEIRPPSFRGLMRYWLRAAVAGLASTQPVGLEDVRDFESHIFGATDQGSAVQVRIKTLSETVKKFKKEGHSQDQVTGEDYLYWSMDNSGKGNNYKPARYFLTHDTKLIVTLSVHGQDDIQLRKLECAIASFWLLLSLGGLGSRSRRCAGSLVVTNVSGNTTKLSFTEARDAQDLREILSHGIQEVRRSYLSRLAEMEKKNGPSTPLAGAKIDTLTLPDYCRIWILRRNSNGKSSPWSSVDNALSDIGQELQAYRRNVQPLENRAILGLPLIVQKMHDSDLKKALENNRRASPLLLKISRLQGGQYVGIATLFKTQYQATDMIPEPDYSLIEEWIEKKLTRMTASEVVL